MLSEREELAEAMLAASRALVGIAMRGVEAVAPEVTLAQHRVLLLLADRGELSVGEIAGLLGVNQSNASRHAGRLAALGLLTRERDPDDARTVTLRMTDAGRARVRAVRAARLREITSVLARMDLDEVRAAAAGLRAFEQAADALAESALVTGG